MLKLKNRIVSIQTIFFKNMMLVAFTSVVLWSLIWVFFEYSTFLTESESIRKHYLENQKTLLKTEVSNLLSYIIEMKKQIQGDSRKNPVSRDWQTDIDAQKEVLMRIAHLRFGTEGYFFGSTDTGEPLFSNGKITIGTKSVWNLTDPDGVKIIQEQKKAAQNPEGGFVHYRWEKLDSEHPYPKLSFVMRLPAWNWTVGAGLYLDTIETTIAKKRDELKVGLLRKLTAIFFILSALFILIFYWANHISGKLHKAISTFSSFFERAATRMITIDPEKLHFKELQEIADGANKMIIEKQLFLEEKIKLEQQLRQSHKMEAIGTLAGGIAHDINNILSVIIGNAELAAYDIDELDPVLKNLEAIKISSLNARNIVRQLLSFSRQTDEKKAPVNINSIIKESIALLRSSINSSISIQLNLAPEMPLINANHTQIHQILLNLCSNAAHAMEQNGGVLEISTRLTDANYQQDDSETQSSATSPLLEDLSESKQNVNPGKHILLSIRDNGHGIDPGIMEKIFDPYFTTKETGKGTGMGLAVVHGIIKNHNGTISVKSTQGQGTTFDILLPVISDTQVIISTPPQTDLITGEGHILFVDDDKSLADMSKDFLEHLGYKVTAFINPVKALAAFREAPDLFQLVITDMSMPVMNGKELIQKILEIRADLPVILCTGYHDKINHNNAKESGITKYFEKPVDNFEFAREIHDIMVKKYR
ncbi:MAG: cache domain-containing protein [Desulfamplus sp.]|nr:cache domain-containing protein [Desulfamplus sp.]